MENSAVDAMRQLSKAAQVVGVPMIQATPEDVQDGARQILSKMVVTIIDEVAHRFSDLSTGQQLYVAAAIATMLAYGFGEEFAEKFGNAEDDLEAIQRLMDEVTRGEGNPDEKED